jgi:HEAT repeat protein
MVKGCINRLIEHLTTGDDWHRRQAADALGSMGLAARQAAPYLVFVLEDENDQVRYSAGIALAEMNWEGEPPQVLIDATHHDDPAQRIWAMTALGGMASAPTWVITEVVRLLKDSDAVVRICAGEALLSLLKSPTEVKGVLGQAFAKEPYSVTQAAAEAVWDAWPGNPRAALAALALLSLLTDKPEAHPEAMVLVEEIIGHLDKGNCSMISDDA